MSRAYAHMQKMGSPISGAWVEISWDSETPIFELIASGIHTDQPPSVCVASVWTRINTFMRGLVEYRE